MEEQVFHLSPDQLDELIEVGEEIILRLDNLTAGFQILLYIAVALFVWLIIRVLYKLFGGVFFGGI